MSIMNNRAYSASCYSSKEYFESMWERKDSIADGSKGCYVSLTFIYSKNCLINSLNLQLVMTFISF